MGFPTGQAWRVNRDLMRHLLCLCLLILCGCQQPRRINRAAMSPADRAISSGYLIEGMDPGQASRSWGQPCKKSRGGGSEVLTWCAICEDKWYAVNGSRPFECQKQRTATFVDGKLTEFSQ